MSSNIDIFLATAFENNISRNLSKNTLERIKSRLLEKHAKFLPQAIAEFHYLDDVLFEFFGAGKDGLIKQFCNDICMVSESDNSIHVMDESLEKTILELLSDQDQKRILTHTMNSPMTIKEMVTEISDISEKEALSKISDLVTKCILVPKINSNGITYYYNIIQEIDITTTSDKLNLKIILKENISKSVLLQKITS